MEKNVDHAAHAMNKYLTSRVFGIFPPRLCQRQSRYLCFLRIERIVLIYHVKLILSSDPPCIVGVKPVSFFAVPEIPMFKPRTRNRNVMKYIYLFKVEGFSAIHEKLGSDV
ncbi:hypothetical protein SCHPADRAFT_308586 [Schizopora paradoxa]|uniref:Uncharacterized protein n=1 Tax=Schizopora paradoxa TaxID=27342 RepID=A0A0H2RRE3_9AGAM|nr:hypothetical protein SCHPADRAFT_308586 [Schizopora paradoxa]